MNDKEHRQMNINTDNVIRDGNLRSAREITIFVTTQHDYYHGERDKHVLQIDSDGMLGVSIELTDDEFTSFKLGGQVRFVKAKSGGYGTFNVLFDYDDE